MNFIKIKNYPVSSGKGQTLSVNLSWAAMGQWTVQDEVEIYHFAIMSIQRTGPAVEEG